MPGTEDPKKKAPAKTLAKAQLPAQSTSSGARFKGPAKGSSPSVISDAASVRGDEFEEIDAAIDDYVFDYDALNASETAVAAKLIPLQAKDFRDLTKDLAIDRYDQLRREELAKTTAPSFYQRCLSGDLPNLDLLLEQFKDGQISLSFKRELEKTNTNVLIRILKQTADAYNSDFKKGEASPDKQKVMQTLLFETIKKTIKEFDAREENELKEIKLAGFVNVLERKSDEPQLAKIKAMINAYKQEKSPITSKQIEDEIVWYNFTNPKNKIELQYPEENKIRVEKRKSLLEKNAAIAGMLKLVQEPSIEAGIKQKSQELKEQREELKKQELLRRQDSKTNVIRRRKQDGSYEDNQDRIVFTNQKIKPIEDKIKKLMDEIKTLEELTITEKFADYQSSDHTKVGDLMEGMYQQAYGAEGFGPQKDDIDALRQLNLLSSVTFQVGRKELQQHYDRILQNLGVRSPADIPLPANSPFYHEYTRLRNFLFEMRDYLEASYGESFLPSRQFDGYMQELAKSSSRKVAWRDAPGRMSLLVTGNNTPVCSMGGARRRADEGGAFSQAMLINLGNFGDIKFGFNPITGKAFAVKKETSGKWTGGRSGPVFDYFKRVEGKAGYQDESTAAEYINERDVERTAGLLVGVVSRTIDQKLKAQLAKQKGISKVIDKTTAIASPVRFSEDVLEKHRELKVPEEYKVNLTVQELLPKPRDLKDEIEELSLISVGPNPQSYNVGQCLTRLDMAIKYTHEAYIMMADNRIIHLDIKPKNFQGVHFDFGTSRVVGAEENYETATHTFDFVKGGTPEYMAPELFAAADVRLKSRLELHLEITRLEKLVEAKNKISAARTLSENKLKVISNNLSLDFQDMLQAFDISTEIFKPKKPPVDPARAIHDKINANDYASLLSQKQEELSKLDRQIKDKPAETITADYKADIYSIGASIFGESKAGIYLDTFYMRKGKYPDYHEDDEGKKFQIVGKVNGGFVGKYYNDSGTALKSESIQIDPEQYIRIGKEFSEPDNDARQRFNRKGFESEGLRIIDWAQKVADNNPENREAQDIVVKLKEIRDRMLDSNPANRTQLNPADPSKPDLENGLSLLEISLRLEHYKQRLTSLKDGMSAQAKELYRKIDIANREVADPKIQKETLLADYIDKTYDRNSIHEKANGSDRTSLLSLFIEQLPDEYVASFVIGLFRRLLEGTIKNVFKEKNGLESLLISAVKHNKPKTFKALIEKLPAGTISNILTNPQFNETVGENQRLLHRLAKQDSTQSIKDFLDHVFTKGSEEDKNAVKAKLLQNLSKSDIPVPINDNDVRIELTKHNPAVWAIYNKNYELLEKYCQILGHEATKNYRVSGEGINPSEQESLFHIAAKQSDKKAYDILKSATGLTDKELSQAGFIPGQAVRQDSGTSAAAAAAQTNDGPGVSSLFYAFEDCPELVQDYCINAESIFGDNEKFLKFLSDNNNKYGMSPLLLAIKGNNKVLLKLLFDYIERNYNPEQKSQVFSNLRNADGKHALAYCVGNDNVELFNKITGYILEQKDDKAVQELVNEVFLTSKGEEHSVLQHLILDENPAHVAGGQKMLFKLCDVMVDVFDDGSDKFSAECCKALGQDLLMPLARKGALSILNIVASSSSVPGDEYRKFLSVQDQDSGDTVLMKIMQQPDAAAVIKVLPTVLAACMKDARAGTLKAKHAEQILRANLFKPNKQGKSALQKVYEHGSDKAREIIVCLNANGVTFSEQEKSLINSYNEEKTRTKVPLVDWKQLDDLREQTDVPVVSHDKYQAVQLLQRNPIGYAALAARPASAMTDIDTVSDAEIQVVVANASSISASISANTSALQKTKDVIQENYTQLNAATAILATGTTALATAHAETSAIVIDAIIHPSSSLVLEEELDRVTIERDSNEELVKTFNRFRTELETNLALQKALQAKQETLETEKAQATAQNKILSESAKLAETEARSEQNRLQAQITGLAQQLREANAQGQSNDGLKRQFEEVEKKLREAESSEKQAAVEIKKLQEANDKLEKQAKERLEREKDSRRKLLNRAYEKNESAEMRSHDKDSDDKQPSSSEILKKIKERFIESEEGFSQIKSTLIATIRASGQHIDDNTDLTDLIKISQQVSDRNVQAHAKSQALKSRVAELSEEIASEKDQNSVAAVVAAEELARLRIELVAFKELSTRTAGAYSVLQVVNSSLQATLRRSEARVTQLEHNKKLGLILQQEILDRKTIKSDEKAAWEAIESSSGKQSMKEIVTAIIDSHKTIETAMREALRTTGEDNVEDLSIRALTQRFNDFIQTVPAVRAELTASQQAVADLTAAAKAAQEKYDSKIAEGEASNEAAQTANAQLKQNLETQVESLQQLKTTLAESKAALEDLEQQNKSLTESAAKVQGLEQDRARLIAETAQLRTQLSEAEGKAEHDTTTAARQIAELTEQLADKQGELQAVRDELTAARTENEQIVTHANVAAQQFAEKLEKQTDELASLKAEIESRNTQIENQKIQIAELEASVSAIREQADKIKEKLEKQLADQTSEKTRSEEEKTELTSKLESLNTTLVELEKELETARDKVKNHEDLQVQLQASTAQVASLENEKSELTANVARLENELVQTGRANTAAESVNAELSAQLAEKSSQLEAVALELRQAQTNNEQITEAADRAAEQSAEQIAAQEKRVAEVTAELTGVVEASGLKATEIERLDSELTTLKPRIAELEGQIRDIETARGELKSHLETGAEVNAELTQKLADITATLMPLQTQLADARAKVVEFDRQAESLKTAESRIGELQSEQSQNRAELDKLKAELINVKTSSKEIDVEKDRAIADLKAQVVSKEGLLDGITQQLARIEQGNADIKEQAAQNILKLTAQLDQQKVQAAKALQQVDAAHAQVVAAKQEQISMLTDELRDARDHIETARADALAAGQQVVQLRTEKEATKKNIQELDEQLNEAQAKNQRLLEEKSGLNSSNIQYQAAIEEHQQVVQKLHERLRAAEQAHEDRSRQLEATMQSMRELRAAIDEQTEEYTARLEDLIQINSVQAQKKQLTTVGVIGTAMEAQARAEILRDEATEWAVMTLALATGLGMQLAQKEEAARKSAMSQSTEEDKTAYAAAAAAPGDEDDSAVSQQRADSERRGEQRQSESSASETAEKPAALDVAAVSPADPTVEHSIASGVDPIRKLTAPDVASIKKDAVTAEFKSLGDQSYKVITEAGKDNIRAVVDMASFEGKEKDAIALCAEIFELTRRAGSKKDHLPIVTLGANTKDPVLAATFYLIAKQFEDQGLITLDNKLDDSFIKSALQNTEVAKNLKLSFSLDNDQEIDSEIFVQNFMTIQASKHLAGEEPVVRRYLERHAQGSAITEAKLNDCGGLFNTQHGTINSSLKDTYGSVSSLSQTGAYGAKASHGLAYAEQQAISSESAHDAIQNIKLGVADTTHRPSHKLH